MTSLEMKIFVEKNYQATNLLKEGIRLIDSLEIEEAKDDLMLLIYYLKKKIDEGANRSKN